MPRNIRIITEGFADAPEPVRRWAYAYACERAEESNGQKPVEARLRLERREVFGGPHWELDLAVGMRLDFPHTFPDGDFKLRQGEAPSRRVVA